MKLTEIDNKTFTDQEIDLIVYSNISDNGKNCKYALVFGNDMLIKERVSTAVDLYKNKRVEKLIFMGGKNGISNQDNNISEAEKMYELSLKSGVKETDILLDDKSNNTFENIDNAIELIGSEITELDNILVVTSEFHLKRCLAILKNKLPNINVSLVPAKDGFSDKDNWFLSDNSWNSGRSLATYEAGLLVKSAKEGKISNIEISNEINDKD